MYLYGQNLTSVTVSAADDTVGRASIHTVTFTTQQSIPSDGRIVILYPSGFDVTSVSIVSSSTMDGTLSITSTAGDSVVITRSGGTEQAAGQTETIRLANVRNHTSTATNPYTITVKTENNDVSLRDTGTYSSFTVDHGRLDHFQVAGVGASVTAGSTFTLTVTAQDFYNNTATSFTSTASLLDYTGTISPSVTAGFTAGVWSSSTITITKKQTSNVITVTASGKSGTSASFNVIPAGVDHFSIATVTSPQTSGTPFNLVMTALDAYDNTAEGFTGTVSISSSKGTISPSTSGSFSLGVYTEPVTITQANSDLYITINDGSSHIGTSNFFNVQHGALSGFQLATIADQVPGAPFSVTVTAQDANGNTVTSFNGTGNTVNIVHTGAGSISPTVSGNFINGIWIGNISIAQTQSGDHVTVTRTGGSETGTSNAFNVTPSTVDHFSISSIGGTQTAGTGFSVTVTAQDINNNTVTSFTGTANLTDLTGTALPQQITFTAGVWTGTVTITQSRTGNALTVTGVGKSTTSNTFTVNPAGVNHFDFTTVTSPQTAGTGFSIVMTARDAYGNTATGFVGTVSITDNTGTLTPATSGSFVSGVRTQSVTITRAQNDVRITVTRTGGTENGASNYFNVQHGSLSSFAIATIADQATGLPFSITVTARDANNNTVTSFSGAGNTVGISHSGTGSISPATSGDFTSGLWTGNVTIPLTQTADRITVTRTGGGTTGLSNTFNVTPSTVDHFVISSIGVTQTAGTGFTVTVTAQDAGNNTVSSFTGTVNLIDETGTNTPQQIVFSGGVWTGLVTITKASIGNTLTASGVGKSGTSNTFDVIPASVNAFQIGLVASPQAAGIPFSITITALDAYGNTATGFNSTVSISDVTGTLTPATSGSFTSGVRTESVTITRAQNDVRITVQDGSGHTGTSNLFNIIPGAVHHFVIGTVGDQTAGAPFSITVQAQDTYNNIASAYTGTVDIVDNTGTIRPLVSGSFTSGLWSGGVTVFQAVLGDRITVTRTGGTETGISNTFNIYAPPGVRLNQVTPSRTTVTAGQTQDWTLTLEVQNLAGSFATLDSVRIQFRRSGAIQSDYTLILPATFETSHTAVLAGGATDHLRVVVDRTGAGTGNITVDAKVYLTDSGTGGNVWDQAFAGITVQDSARLVILQVAPSQPEVTVGQQEDWTASVIILNAGESDALIDSSPAGTAISFSIGTGWQITRPSEFNGGGWTLSGGERDTLTYIITTTGAGAAGSCEIHATVGGTEQNTGRAVTDNTVDSGSGSVEIENAAALRIVQVTNLAPNAPYVNRSQNYSIRVNVQNTGGDDATDVQVNLSSDGLSVFPSSTVIGDLAAGGSTSIDITGFAASATDPLEIFTASADGRAENNDAHILSSNALDDTARSVVQNPAALIVEILIPSSTNLLGGQVDPWTVKAVVRNTGQASFVLNTPQAADLSFYVNSISQTDYGINAPAALKGGGLTLTSGRRDTLIYTVTSTGRLGGTVEVRASISGKDKNNNAVQTRTNTTNVTVQAETAFRIISTHVIAPHHTEAGNGYVNRSQSFKVTVVIENGLGETVSDIRVALQRNGSSVITQTPLSISRMAPARWDSVQFTVTAAAAENSTGEIFTASVSSATLEHSGFPAPVGRALDSLAVVYIQSAAQLSMTLELTPSGGIVSASQIFTCTVRLANAGTSEVAQSGYVKLSLPSNYLRVSPVDSLQVNPGTPVQWSIRAPSHAQTASSILVTMSSLPRELNTGNPASMPTRTVSVNVTTIVSSLTTTVVISSPQGAQDGVLSSDQTFVVKASFQFVNVENMTAEISLPPNFVMNDQKRKSIIPDTPDVFWQVRTPAQAAGMDMVVVTAEGYDAIVDTVRVPEDSDTLYIYTIARADLEMDLSIIAPEDALDGSISLGQFFEVRALVTNSGTADTLGAGRVTLSPLPAGFTLSPSQDAMTKMLSNGEAHWTIKAPNQPSQQPVSIQASLSSIPLDENTNEYARVTSGSDFVAVTIFGSFLTVSKIDNPGGIQNLNVIGAGQQNVRLMGLRFRNEGLVGTARIILESLAITLEDRDNAPIPLNSILSGVYLASIRTGEPVSAAYPTTGIQTEKIQIPFSAEVTAEADSSVDIAVMGNLAADLGSPQFRVNIASGADVVARDYDSGAQVLVKNIMEDELENLRSMLFGAVLDVLWNCPNPFGEPGKEQTTFIYTLAEDMGVQFKIYTLVGKLVWESPEYTSSDAQGRAGSHAGDVLWNGQNSAGEEVQSGVYLLIMKTEVGQVQKTKIAFVK